MSLGYDPKWELVRMLLRFEVASSNQTPCERTQGLVTLYNGAAISKLSSHFPAGALSIADQASPSKRATVNFIVPVFFGQDVLIENQFVATSWGIGGRRVIAHSANIVLYLLPDDHSIRFAVKLGGETWVDIGYELPDPDGFIGALHFARFRSSSTRLSIELDGVEVVATNHGVASFNTENQQFNIGNAWVPGPDQVFLGYIGQFRMTVGDLRPELYGQPMERFPVLGAVDALREKVVSHLHFEPTPEGVPVDTKGLPVVLEGAATVVSTSRKYGVASISFGAWTGGSVRVGPAPGFIFGGQDFAVEGYVIASLNNPDGAPLFAVKNATGQAMLGVRIAAGGGYNNLVVHIGGSTLTFAGTSISSGYFLVCRQGEKLAVFFNGTRRALIDIGTLSIDGDGYFHWGWPTIFGATQLAACGIDEGRITLGASRVSVDALSIPVPTEPFSEYGPRSLSGTIIDADGNPLVRTVRAYHRLTGRLISETISATDGTWSLPVADTGEHFVVVHDDVKNALIYDRVQPVLVT